MQPDLISGSISENFSLVREMLTQLGKKGTDIALLPELWSCGFDNDSLALHADKTPEIVDELSQIASFHRMMIGGSLPEKEGNAIFNTFYLHDRDGRLLARYRKIHLFTMAGEDRYFGRGNQAVVCDTAVGRAGLLICYDLRFPELCRMLAVNGARIILVSAQWPEGRIGQWDTLLKARAIENQVVVIAANRLGSDLGNRYVGHSQIVSPTGNLLGFAGAGESLVEAEIDLSEIDHIRSLMPVLQERRPDVYGA